jgi:hypothetical protein
MATSLCVAGRTLATCEMVGDTVKSSNFVTRSKFRHPSIEFLWSSAKFILKDIKKLYNTISTCDVASRKNWSYLVFFKVLHLATFFDETKFENFKKSSKKHQQGGILHEGYKHGIFI